MQRLLYPGAMIRIMARGIDEKSSVKNLNRHPEPVGNILSRRTEDYVYILKKLHREEMLPLSALGNWFNISITASANCIKRWKRYVKSNSCQA
jgi:hypothetical protein